MFEIEKLIHFLPSPKSKSELGKFGTAFAREVEVVAYTSFGDLFMRDKQTNQIALALLVPFKVIPLNAFSMQALIDLFSGNPNAAFETLHFERAVELQSKLGLLGPEEVYIPHPYPIWGGDNSIESYKKGNVWVHVQLVTD